MKIISTRKLTKVPLGTKIISTRKLTRRNLDAEFRRNFPRRREQLLAADEKNVVGINFRRQNQISSKSVNFRRDFDVDEIRDASKFYFSTKVDFGH